MIRFLAPAATDCYWPSLWVCYVKIFQKCFHSVVKVRNFVQFFSKSWNRLRKILLAIYIKISDVVWRHSLKIKSKFEENCLNFAVFPEIFQKELSPKSVQFCPNFDFVFKKWRQTISEILIYIASTTLCKDFRTLPTKATRGMIQTFDTCSES